MIVVDLPIESVLRRADARQLNDHALIGIAESINVIGLVNPIRVRQVGDRYEIIAGSHRFAACDSLGHPTIAAVIVDDDDIHAELAMIDENLCRAELSPSDRAKAIARRKAIYLELNPETANGSNQHTRVGQVVQPNFAVATAALTGADARTVRRDAERGEKISDEALSVVRGTSLDRGNYLDGLKSVPRDQQVERVRNDLASPRLTGGIASRYAPAATQSKPPAADIFDRFLKLADEIAVMPLVALVDGAGRQRSLLGQRASSLAEMMSDIMERLDL